MKLKLFLILYFLTYAIELRSHELWLEAEDFRLNKGSKLIANIKVGENLIGESYPFLKKEILYSFFLSSEILSGEYLPRKYHFIFLVLNSFIA